MKKHHKKIARLLSIFLLLIFSCTSQDEELEDLRTEPSDPVYSYIMELGFKASDVVDKGDRYVAEGDIAFPKNMPLPSKSKGGRVSQLYSSTLVTFVRQPNIRIKIDASMSSMSAEVSTAIAYWNPVGSNIHFNVVTSGAYDILIYDDPSLGSNVCGEAGFPLNGDPYDTMKINKSGISSNSYTQRAATIAHELGHCIGFWHTTSSAGTTYTDPVTGVTWTASNVPGFSGGDTNSLMNGGQCNAHPAALTAKDQGALLTLYRDPRPANVQIQITSSQFIISWTNPTIMGPGDTHYENEVNYGGFSGMNFGGVVHLSSTSTSYTVPGVTPFPSSNGTTGGIQTTIVAKYTNSSYGAPTVTRLKSGGVWQ